MVLVERSDSEFHRHGYLALSGLGLFSLSNPRALPWADLFRPLRATPRRIFSSIFRPEGPFLKAQAAGLGIRWRDNRRPEGAIRQVTLLPNRPFRASKMPKTPSFPGLRPGLTETAFQAGNSGLA